MRYGLGDLPDGRRSAVRWLVSEQLVRARLSLTQAAEVTGLSRNTLVALGIGPSRPQTILKLGLLGIPHHDLERAEAIDAQRRAGLVFPDDIYDLVIAAMHLGREDKKILADIASVMARRHHSPPDP